MKEAANLFADYFSSVYENHVNSFEINNNNISTDNAIQINADSIMEIMSEIDEFKTNSPDGIPGIFYKRTIHSIFLPLQLLFSLSIKSMKYPDKWKIGYISPIYKAGNNTDVENYRPISGGKDI